MSFLETGTGEDRSSVYTDDAEGNKPNRMVDQATVAKPTVDYQDKLWTQIDILDDVKQMAQQTREQMENSDRAESLRKLKQEQLAVVQRIREQEQLMDAEGAAAQGQEHGGFDRAFFTKLDEHLTKIEEDMDAVSESLKVLNKQ